MKNRARNSTAQNSDLQTDQNEDQQERQSTESAAKRTRKKQSLWQQLEKQMIFNAKALEANEALKMSRELLKMQSDEVQEEVLDKFR